MTGKKIKVVTSFLYSGPHSRAQHLESGSSRVPDRCEGMTEVLPFNSAFESSSSSARWMRTTGNSQASTSLDTDSDSLSALFSSASFALVTPRDVELSSLSDFLRSINAVDAKDRQATARGFGGGFNAAPEVGMTPPTTPATRNVTLPTDWPGEAGGSVSRRGSVNEQHWGPDWSRSGGRSGADNFSDARFGARGPLEGGLRAPAVSRERTMSCSVVGEPERDSIPPQPVYYNGTTPNSAYQTGFGLEYINASPSTIPAFDHSSLFHPDSPYGSDHSSPAFTPHYDAYPSPTFHPTQSPATLFTSSPPTNPITNSLFGNSTSATFQLPVVENLPSSYRFDAPRQVEEEEEREDVDEEMMLD